MRVLLLVIGCTLTLVGALVLFDYCLGRIIGTFERRGK